MYAYGQIGADGTPYARAACSGGGCNCDTSYVLGVTATCATGNTTVITSTKIEQYDVSGNFLCSAYWPLS